MYSEFNPYPKSKQLAGHQKEKDRPKFKVQKPKKPKKKLEVYKGRSVPDKKTRGKISKSDYELAIELHGYECWVCGISQGLECHHVVPKGYSKARNGRGVVYNLRFLCTEHHRGKTGVHQNRELMQKLQDEHERLYGEHFYKDAWDLFKENLIPTPTKECYEKFMKTQERR